MLYNHHVVIVVLLGVVVMVTLAQMASPLSYPHFKLIQLYGKILKNYGNQAAVAKCFRLTELHPWISKIFIYV